jgi:hypothetical protein
MFAVRTAAKSPAIPTIFGALCCAIERCVGEVAVAMRIDITFSYGRLFLVAVTRPCASATRLFCAKPRVFSVNCVTPETCQRANGIDDFLALA